MERREDYQTQDRIRPHEIAAIEQMILAIRVTAMLLTKDPQQVARMQNWAQTAEDYLDRVSPTEKR